MNFYPIKFTPIYKERIWGGTSFQSLFKRDISIKGIGESWEISTVPDNYSIVSNGDLSGKTILDLINLYPEEILGNECITKYGEQFPLLFKFIDAKEDLSIQVHPNDELAQKRHQSYGKTEMWYVVNAEKEAHLIVGFNKNTNSEEYSNYLKNNALIEILNKRTVASGDVYFLETGTVHAIGAGCLIAEIQQTSDITYRLYDWDRLDDNGNQRELHTELALDAINYNITSSKREYIDKLNQENNIVTCNYFCTNKIIIEASYQWLANNDKFTVFMCVEGNGDLITDYYKESIKLGETILVPACIGKILIKGSLTLLEVTI